MATTSRTDFVCWRNPSHAIGVHPVLGWPECSVCRAAPPYWERGQYLPETFELGIYVPDGTGYIAGGSAVVGYPIERPMDETTPPYYEVLVYYEGWIHGACQYEGLDARGRWEAGLLHAADRLVTAYPTAAMATLPAPRLKRVGSYDPKHKRIIEITDNEALEAWLA